MLELLHQPVLFHLAGVGGIPNQIDIFACLEVQMFALDEFQPTQNGDVHLIDISGKRRVGIAPRIRFYAHPFNPSLLSTRTRLSVCELVATEREEREIIDAWVGPSSDLNFGWTRHFFN
jgi:hypothetical protein